jgi:membrane-associated phospholipid phosphatase
VQANAGPAPSAPGVPDGARSWARRLVAAGLSPFAAFATIVLVGFAAGAGALWLFAAVAEDVAAKESQALDDAVTAWVRQLASPGLDAAARAASALGSEVLAVAAVLLIVGFAWRRRWRTVGLIVVTLAGAQLLNDILKELFHRTRPAPLSSFIPSQAYSFPSGHAMMSAAFYFLLVCLFWRTVGRRWRPLMVAGAVLVIGLVAVSRIYLQAHYLTDVVAGDAAGFLWTDAVLLGGQALRVRRTAPAPA